MIKNIRGVLRHYNRIKPRHRWNPSYLNYRRSIVREGVRDLHASPIFFREKPIKDPYTQMYEETSKSKKDKQETVDGDAIKASIASDAEQNRTISGTDDDQKSIQNEPERDPDQEHLTTVFEDMEPYVDTYNVYKELVKTGFTGTQADSIIDFLIVQLNYKLSKLLVKYSQKYELENECYLFESAQEELRVDFTRSREQHINELINLINVLERDFNVISDELNSDFIQMRNDNQVSMNDQKSENTLQSKQISLKIQETNHKITTELNSAMRSEIESLRWHLSRWGLISILVCVFSGCTLFYIHKVRATEKQTKDEFVPLVIYEPSEFDEDDYHTDIDRNLV